MELISHSIYSYVYYILFFPLAFLLITNVSADNTSKTLLAQIQEIRDSYDTHKDCHILYEEMIPLIEVIMNEGCNPLRLRMTIDRLQHDLHERLNHLAKDDDMYEDMQTLLHRLCTRECDLNELVEALHRGSAYPSAMGGVHANVEILYNIGLEKEACILLDRLNEHFPDGWAIDAFAQKNDAISFFTQTNVYRIVNYLLLSHLCDPKLDYSQALGLFVKELEPYKDSRWLSLVLVRGFNNSRIWGAHGVDRNEKYYDFLCAIEPLVRNDENPEASKHIDTFYFEIIRYAEMYGHYEDMLKWSGIAVARCKSGFRANFKMEYGAASKLLREQHGTPNPHEYDIKMMEELGLLFE